MNIELTTQQVAQRYTVITGRQYARSLIINQMADRFFPPTTPPRRTMIPNDAPIIQLLRPSTDLAVTEALDKAHYQDPEAFHAARRIPVGERCHHCPSELSEELEARIDALTEGYTLAPWQRRLISEIAKAQLDAEADTPELVVEDEFDPNATDASPALQAYLAERELVADEPTYVAADVQLDRATDEQFTLVDHNKAMAYGELTAKELRPLASAAGMKGARVAKKADMVEFLAAL